MSGALCVPTTIYPSDPHGLGGHARTSSDRRLAGLGITEWHSHPGHGVKRMPAIQRTYIARPSCPQKSRRRCCCCTLSMKLSPSRFYGSLRPTMGGKPLIYIYCTFARNRLEKRESLEAVSQSSSAATDWEWPTAQWEYIEWKRNKEEHMLKWFVYISRYP